MKDSAILGDVDLFTVEHSVDTVFEARFLGQLKKQLDGLIGNAILRIVKEEAYSFDGQSFATGGISSE